MSDTSRHRKLLVAAVFLVAIYVPFALSGRTASLSELEKRKLDPAPALPATLAELERFPGRLESYAADRFGLRPQLVAFGAALRLDLFRSSLHPKVGVGRDGWLFFTPRYTLADRLGLERIPARELRQWRVLLEERRDWLAARGADFLFVVAPAKLSVYPQYAPAFLRESGGPTRREQFFAYLAQHPDLEVLNLAPALQQASAHERVYYRTDTHWNSRGAFVGYREIAKRLPRHIPADEVLELGDMRPVDCELEPGLPRLLGLLHVEPDRCLEPVGGRETEQVPPSDPRLVALVDRAELKQRELAGAPGGRAVFLGDSYLNWDRPFLARHFRRSLYMNFWRHGFDSQMEAFPERLLAEQRPHLVVMQILETHLRSCGRVECMANPRHMTNAPEVRQERLRRLFAKAGPSVRARHDLERREGAPGSERFERPRFPFGELPDDGSTAWIARLRVRSAGPARLRALPSPMRGPCARNLEVQEVRVGIPPGGPLHDAARYTREGQEDVFLCVARFEDYPTFWLEWLEGEGPLQIERVDVRPHPDVLPAEPAVPAGTAVAQRAR